jgi:hypothetical protein
MKKITKYDLETASVVFNQFDTFCIWYPNGLDVSWKCFREALYNDIQMKWFCKFQFMDYEDRKFVEKHTETKMVRVKDCYGGFLLKNVIDHHGLKRMEKVFLKKTSLGDIHYRRR